MSADRQATLAQIQQLFGQNQFEQAEQICRQALEAQRDDPDFLHALGCVLERRGQLTSARHQVERAIAMSPQNPTYYNTQGVILGRLGKIDEAMEALSKSIQLQASLAPAHANRAALAYSAGRIDAAISGYQQTIALAPDDPNHHIALAAALARQGRLEEVIAECRGAIAVAPQRADLYHHLLYYLWFTPGIPVEQIVKEHIDWGRLVSVFGRNARAHDNDRDPDRRLRIGYVSPDLRDHVIGYFLSPVLAAHERNNVEVFCYFHGARDAITEQLERHAHHWVNTHSLDDDQLAERIRADRIDILIDLSLHMAMNRLILFTRRPAPVQATYLSYPGTSGLAQMDYRITDCVLEPPQRRDGWLGPERLARLEQCYWCYRPPPEAPAVVPCPSASNGYVTLGSTNNFMKVNRDVIALWAKVLKRLPAARLRFFIKGGEEHNRPVMTAFADAGVDRAQLEPRDQLPYVQYLASYNDIDIALDPFPYNGGTTTFDALYMGVPVITLSGELPVGRFGATIMSNLGLNQLIASSPDDYVQKAVQLANNVSQRTELRQTLRPMLMRSHLTDAVRFTRQLEQTYRMMWRRWCGGPRQRLTRETFRSVQPPAPQQRG